MNLIFPFILQVFASSDNEYCVLAIQTGKLEYPNFSNFPIFSIAFKENSTSAARYIFVAIFCILFLNHLLMDINNLPHYLSLKIHL